MMRSFTVRPQPKTGESLTSFLSTVANRNSRQLKDILRMLEVTSDDLRRRDYYRLDFIPSRYVPLESLSELTGVSPVVLNALTFQPLIKKFFDYKEPESANVKLTLQRDIDVQHRRFCPACLKENGVYQLLWQTSTVRS
ncbi:TniQ family protein [Alicyclobacillus sp. SO9]|uniref:TniQ family protein n=1 Tax=Alicyclobacillus sp. SO9 TaxID=2665646 RepID=UPI0018E8218F|nr:TniQ family protein [Alicyclobacillus sp. SO9]QQE78375.1 TniQ family protein [Alicyclobacillus sp. SO9]